MDFMDVRGGTGLTSLKIFKMLLQSNIVTSLILQDGNPETTKIDRSEFLKSSRDQEVRGFRHFDFWKIEVVNLATTIMQVEVRFFYGLRDGKENPRECIEDVE